MYTVKVNFSNGRQERRQSIFWTEIDKYIASVIKLARRQGYQVVTNTQALKVLKTANDSTITIKVGKE